MAKQTTVSQHYRLASERYAELGIDTERAIGRLRQVSISLHCWQGDDVRGFESDAGLTGGGIQATGNYPGRARNVGELRDDLEMALRLIPGQHRLNLHAIYAEYDGKRVERDELAPSHFVGWTQWAKAQGLGLDFNPTFFSHPLADAGFTLASRNAAIRRFWIGHGIACRKIGESFGRELGTACVTNVWIPDGYKDTPIDRRGPRELLKQSLNEIFATAIDEQFNVDAVECKLFGIGSESYVVGSHEFYLGYALAKRKLLCLDSGHFHPTEGIADKISSVLTWLPQILLHVSRGVRWDSDHVVILSDELRAIAEEIVRGDFLPRVRIGLDFFDASINRVAAWVIGTRAMQKALLIALLEPTHRLRQYEEASDYTRRLALLEEFKTLPWGTVWDHFCETENVPAGSSWLEPVGAYERDRQAKRE